MSFIYALQATWNDVATLFDGIALNASNGAGGVPVYAPGSQLLNLKANNITKFSIDPTGTPYFGNSNAAVGYLIMSNGAGVAPTFSGFTGAAVDAITRSWLSKNQDIVSLKDWNPAANGVINDTTAFTKAFTYCRNFQKSLYIPAGNYLYTPPLNIPGLCKVFGSSQWNTNLISSIGTGNCFILNEGGTTLNQLAFTSAVPRTAGACIYQDTNGLLNKLTDLYFDGAFCAININAGATMRMADLNIVNTVAATGNSIIVNGGSGFVGYRIVADAATLAQPFSHLLLRDSAECLLFGCDMIRALNGSYVNPLSGNSILTFRSTNSLFDTCGVNGMNYAPIGTGLALGHDHNQLWLSNALTAGMLMNATGGASINGVRVISGKMQGGGASYGWRATGNKIANIELSNSNVDAVFNGVYWDDILSGSIRDNVIGPYESNPGCTNGVSLVNGADNVQVVDNKLTGNGTAVVNTATGANNFFRDNIGYQAPWAAYTPTITPAAGAFTVTLTSAAYQQFEKTVVARIDFTITNVGTGAGGINITTPTTSVNNAGIVSGSEIGATQLGVSGNVNAGVATMFLVTGASPIIINYRFSVIITYDAA